MKQSLISALIGAILCIIGIGIGLTVNAQTVVTASVEWNNCNIHTTPMPAPVITGTFQNEYGWNFTGTIGDSPFYTYRTETELHFFLDEAHWYTDGLQVYFSNCNK